MGREARNNKEKQAYKKTIATRIFKAVFAVVFVFVLLPFLAARECYKDNKWPWQNF